MPDRRTILFIPLLAAARSESDLRTERIKAPDFPYASYSVSDRFRRRIRFFITPEEKAERLPLIVSILGSGAESNFLRRGDRFLDGHRILREFFRGKARVLIVEKPGLEMGERPLRPGTSEGASEEFRREYTIERWSEAVSAALRAAKEALAILPKALVLGHSEGGLIASSVAATNPWVTHVASLAGGGPTRLFSLIEFCRAGFLYKSFSDDPEQRVQKLVSDWQEVIRDPENTERFFLGHTYRTWISFARNSCVTELRRTSARVYLAQGTEDRSVSPQATEVLYAELLASGRDCTLDWVIGADHGFQISAAPARDGQREVMERVKSWFFRD